jgi:membrane associated rhomboid family serine protease
MSHREPDFKIDKAFFQKKLALSMLIPGVFVFLMWLVKIIEVLFDLDLSNFGIYPLSLEGLPGVIFSPFIHADFGHLFNNSLPLFFLGTALFYFYSEIAVKVSLWTYLQAEAHGISGQAG